MRIKSVNIVDEASNLQQIYPFFETETSEVLLRQYRQWTRAYGRPLWLKVDAGRTNLGETLQRALEADGTQLLDVPGEAHEQVSRVEVHGRFFFFFLKICWHEFWLRFDQALGLSGWSAFTRPWKPKILSQDDAAIVLFR